MKIDKDQLYHGAALIQIAEHEKFTAINSLYLKEERYNNSFRVNTDIAVYLKYATNPKKPYNEYQFNFKSDHLSDLKEISHHCSCVYIVLVCVGASEICCISYGQLNDLVKLRRGAKGAPEEQYTILVTAPHNKSLRVYVNAPGEKKKIIGEELVIARGDFPNILFS